MASNEEVLHGKNAAEGGEVSTPGSRLLPIALGLGGLCAGAYLLKDSMAPPLSGGIGMAITGFQVLSMLSSYSMEAGTSTAPYSKFADRAGNVAMVASRIGMLIIYTPAVVTSAYFLRHALGNPLDKLPITAALVFTHFVKRDFETLFLHKYSGGMPLASAVFIGIFYALTAALCCSVSTSATLPAVQNQLAIGLFAVGSLGNLYHHWLLANLRSSPSKSTKYVAPTGGLFSLAATPHYLFELVAWLGIAISASQANAMFVFLNMTSYLSGRAVAQNRWNREKFGHQWPSTRRNMVPWLF
uniref:3-oxo-5-alpha-steroid 4-dehydrogenase C-terminal domain-containing protein n=1 Tax=Hemiselmis tepida TaxID=464990 RepID=A0A7S0VGL5_9CRYP|mmetsp:Transcript_16313/g.41279  ORF Transcript_16313/g.41279 Transcript_16313/m.41279 type:complete len:300 (+) Transcript_16313:210-1109(+)